MRRSGTLACAALVITATVSGCNLQTEPEALPAPGNTPSWLTVSMYSSVVQDTMVIDVSIPEGYNAPRSSMRYPVLYMTDGYWRNGQHRVIHEMAFTDKVRPMIIVGIGYPTSYDPDMVRVRDLVRHPGKFLDFIVQELIPNIDRQYRTTSKRTLWGSSYGGFFGMYSLFMYVDKTQGVFQDYIIASPTIRETTLFEGKATDLMGFESRMSRQTAQVNARLYMTVGGNEDPVWFVTPFNELVRTLEARGYTGFGINWLVDPGKDHYTVWEPTLYEGVRMFFRE